MRRFALNGDWLHRFAKAFGRTHEKERKMASKQLQTPIRAGGKDVRTAAAEQTGVWRP